MPRATPWRARSDKAPGHGADLSDADQTVSTAQAALTETTVTLDGPRRPQADAVAGKHHVAGHSARAPAPKLLPVRPEEGSRVGSESGQAKRD